jgi:sulfatase modifying factor 1
VTADGPENLTGEPRTLLYMTEQQCRITWNGKVFAIKPEKGSGYPCVEVSWYGAVAYCNYLSEMEGLTPCYSLDDWTCDWSANGYRLATDAEWENAARGGAEGHRFPWSDTDTIDPSRANFKSNTALDYDLSKNSGDNPDYAIGEYPYTSPVGSFPPNGYGIYDTAGNVWEWCWDYWDEHSYSEYPVTNPHGPATGEYRVVRSGRWGYDAASSRVSGRRHGWPSGRRRMGFRIARSA